MVGDPDTDIGGAGGRFPATRQSVIQALTNADPEIRHAAFAAIIDAYWKPVYKYVRVRWRMSNEDAKDLTQEFFSRVIEKEYFARYDPARARFRTFLRTCLDGFLSNDRKAWQRQKRGGGLERVSLDFMEAENELTRAGAVESDATDLDDYFHREWLRSMFGSAVRDLERHYAESGRSAYFELFERYDLQGGDSAVRPTYGDLARELGLSPTQVTNYLAAARRDFRRLVLDRLRRICASEEEFRAEAQELFGARLG